ncbi:MAG: tRNA (adenosine(37)-N6)-threonylcarbamoyltransferase complex transferase subunit TsaD [Minisyncoccia bacterium]
MIILGIETSCDETAISIINSEKNGEKTLIKVLGNQLFSQIAIHAQYGGVFPMMAKRSHAENMIPLFLECLKEAKLFYEEEKELSEEKKSTIKTILEREFELAEKLLDLAKDISTPKIDAIAVTQGPGLEPALWVGLNFAKAISYLWNIPLIPTNHMEGHIFAGLMKKVNNDYEIITPEMPTIALLISGGHTQLVLSKSLQEYEVIGETRDDAVGEAFDKVARIIGLPYPGGPQISKLADKERTESGLNAEKKWNLPRPMIHSKDLDFSFSGLKTSVLYTVKKIPELTEKIKQEIAREFEDAVVEVLSSKTRSAVEQFGAKTLVLGGGVSANKEIRTKLAKLAEEINVTFFVPEISASTDNSLMIAVAGLFNYSNQKPYFGEILKADGNLKLN